MKYNLVFFSIDNCLATKKYNFLIHQEICEEQYDTLIRKSTKLKNPKAKLSVFH